MIGVLIVAGIIGYGVLYSGIGTTQGKPIGVAQALFPRLKVTASSFPKPKPTASSPTAPRQGRPA